VGVPVNYYPFNVGDYASHTAHLDLLEDLAYRRMLDLYYRTEQPLPREVEQIARLIRMKGHEEAISQILGEFFDDCSDGWSHTRCDEEIARMQDKQAKAKASAAASVKARSTNAQRTLNERSTGVELPTPTPTPTPTPNTNHVPRKRGQVSEFPPGFDRFWSAYPRKIAKALAAKAFARARPDEPTLVAMIAAIAVQQQSPQWQRDGGQFIPHAATWINGRRWEDQPDAGDADPFGLRSAL
jgi:uncharacterized protein YdaU (DUF1376 family)